MAKELTAYDDLDVTSLMTPLFMLVMVMVIMGVMTSITPLQQSAQALQAMVYQGRTDNRKLHASSELKWIDLVHKHPYVGWTWAKFDNAGPNSVKMAINYPDETFTILSGGSATIDRSGAFEKINIVFYFCSSGETAVLDVTAEY